MRQIISKSDVKGKAIVKIEVTHTLTGGNLPQVILIFSDETYFVLTLKPTYITTSKALDSGNLHILQ